MLYNIIIAYQKILDEIIVPKSVHSPQYRIKSLFILASNNYVYDHAN